MKDKQEGKYHCGFLYNDNYLCVSDINNNCIRIWDLINKNLYKTINFDDRTGNEIIQWNDKYTIIGCSKCLIIIDLENGEEYKKIENRKTIYGLKKIKDEKLGECLICSERDNSISIYYINNKKFDILRAPNNDISDESNDPSDIDDDKENEGWD